MKMETPTVFAGLRLRNPTILASGILGLSGEFIGRLVEAGVGAVTTKSSDVRGREGYPNPTVVEVPCGMLNALGLPNPGVGLMKREIMEAKRFGIPVVGSVFGYSDEEYVEAASTVEEAGADAVELNVSCPHVKEVGEIGQNPRLLAGVVRAVKSAVRKPVLVKLSPNVADIAAVGKVAEEAGADGLVAINTVKAMAIDVDVAKPVLAAGFGGLSGPAVKPIAVRCVYELYEAVNIPIAGVGGIVSWQDAVEFILAGARAVEVGTGVLYRDLSVFSEINEGIRKYMEDKGYRSLDEFVGLAHRK